MIFKRYHGGYDEELIALHRRALTGISHGFSQEREEEDIRSIKTTYLDNGGEFLIGFMGGKVVAMGGFTVVDNGVAELKRMRVVGELQGIGIGSELLQELEAVARERKIQRLVLETASSRPKTLFFYRKHGYIPVGKGHYGDQTTVHLAKDLGIA